MYAPRLTGARLRRRASIAAEPRLLWGCSQPIHASPHVTLDVPGGPPKTCMTGLACCRNLEDDLDALIEELRLPESNAPFHGSLSR
jgi:hypothetical protein